MKTSLNGPLLTKVHATPRSLWRPARTQLVPHLLAWVALLAGTTVDAQAQPMRRGAIDM